MKIALLHDVGKNGPLSVPCALMVVESAYQARHRRVEDLAHPQEGCDRDRAACLNLLPVAGGEAERDHVFLGQAASLTQVPNPSAQRAEEIFVFRHLGQCSGTRAKTPRAD